MDREDPHNLTAPPGQHRTPVLIVVVVLLVAGLVAVGLVLVLGGDGDEGTNDGDTATNAGAALSDHAQPESEPFDPSELPESMAGSWEGTITQESTGTTYTVEMTLSWSTPNDQVGTVVYPECSGHYTLRAVDGDSVTLVEHITEGTVNCVDEIHVTLRTVDEDHLSYSFTYEGNPNDGQGTLTRTA